MPGVAACVSDKNLQKVSIIGVGMKSHAGVCSRMMLKSSSATKGIFLTIDMIATMEINSFLHYKGRYGSLRS